MNNISISKAKKLLQHQLNILWETPEKSDLVPPLMIWGPPGVGKSTFIRKLCQENNIGFIDVRLAQREPVDIRGLPVPRDDKSGIDWIVSSEWRERVMKDSQKRESSYSMRLLLQTVHCRLLLTNLFLIVDWVNYTKFQMVGTSLRPEIEPVMVL